MSDIAPEDTKGKRAVYRSGAPSPASSEHLGPNTPSPVAANSFTPINMASASSAASMSSETEPQIPSPTQKKVAASRKKSATPGKKMSTPAAEASSTELTGEATPAPEPPSTNGRTPPKTPRKRKSTATATDEDTTESTTAKKSRGSGKKASGTKVKIEGGDLADAQLKTPTKKAGKKGHGPKTLDEASEADRKLYEMKESGENMNDIINMWKKTTGKEVGAKTLHNRYYVLRDNFARIPPKDTDIMIEANNQYEHDKIGVIAGIMKQKGAGHYTNALIAREYKRVMAEVAAGTYKPAMSDESAEANINDDTTDGQEDVEVKEEREESADA